MKRKKGKERKGNEKRKRSTVRKTLKLSKGTIKKVKLKNKERPPESEGLKEEKKLLVPNRVFVTTSKAPVTRSDALVTSSDSECMERVGRVAKVRSAKKCKRVAVDCLCGFSRHTALSSFLLLVAKPGAPSSVLAPSSKARSP